jgi:predicted Zn-dependent peptidase
VRIGAVVGAALLGAALLVSSAGTGNADVPPASTGSLSGGGTYILRPLAGAPVAAIALWYRAPSSGFGSPAIPGLGRLAASAVAASTPVTGTPLARFVRQVGGRLTIAAYPESISISVLVPAGRAAEAVQSLTRSFFAPVLTDDGFALARQDLLEALTVRNFNHDAALTDAIYASLFASGPDKIPPFGTTATYAPVTADVVRAYAQRAFRPANAVLVATGDVDPTVLAAALPGRAGAAPGPEDPQPEVVSNTLAPVRLIGLDAGFGLGWAGPPIASEREATAFDFIADYLFYPQTGIVQQAASVTGASLVGTFVTYHDPGVFLVSAVGGDETATRAAVDDGLRAIQAPLTPAVFEAARRRFIYHILSDSGTPSTLADTYGWYAVEGDAAYAPGDAGMDGRYLAAAAALTPEFVAATAAKYLDRAGAAITLAGSPAPGAK